MTLTEIQNETISDILEALKKVAKYDLYLWEYEKTHKTGIIYNGMQIGLFSDFNSLYLALDTLYNFITISEV